MDTATDPRAAESLTPPDPSARKRQARNARLIALLDSFGAGDVQQLREEFEELRAGLEAARPGQRRVFSEGFNP